MKASAVRSCLLLALSGAATGFVATTPSFATWARTSKVSLKISLKPAATKADTSVQDLLDYAMQVGPVGSLATEEEQAKMNEMAQKLARQSGIKKPAKAPLRGIHELVYSAAPGGSSGRLFGPVYGRVTQQFLEDDETFINAVTIGPVEISLQAEKIVKNDTTNIVKFRKSIVKVLGRTVVEKEISGGGTWKYLFMGEVDTKRGRKLVRIMETPSLFIIEQPIRDE